MPLVKSVSVRRQRVAGALMVSLAVLLSACGDDTDTATEDTTPTTVATTVPATTSTTGGSAISVKLNATMTGPEEVPPGAPGGSGTASFTLEPSAGRVCYEMSVKDIETANAAHIHEGGKGVAGPIVVPLQPPTPTAKSCTDNVDRAVISRIVANPGGFYVNVHNATYPKGAVRGQLTR